MRKEKLLAVLFFLSLVAENDWVLAYYHDMWTPGRLFEWLTYRLPIKVSVFDLVCVLMLLATRKRGHVARPVIRAMQVSFASMALAAIYGLARGGLFMPIYMQTVAWLMGLVFAMTAIKVCTCAADFRRLDTAIVYAALWRSSTAILYHIKTRDWDWSKMPQCMTTHEDSVVFVVGLIILVSRALELRTKRDVRFLALGAPLILAGIHVNNRRLAWASLAMAVAVVYFMLPSKGQVVRKLNRLLLMLAPLLLVYVVVGWGRPERIFKPLQALSSMGWGQVDNSTRARDNENVSLVTMIKDAPLLGTGLGHEWIEIDSTFTVPLDAFPLYHYSPHDSIFAFLAFYGAIGFAGLWMVIPVSVYLNARTYRTSAQPDERSVAVIGIAQAVAYVNQAYGDMGAMGATHIIPSTILAIGIASAARLSISSGAWPGPTSRTSALHAQRGVG
jgi:hypothetical protein